jgi:Xaa-Pro aminopeptidase
MPDITAFQAALRAARVDGWLLYDFRRSNAIAHRVLGLPPHAFFTRRWLYYVPAQGEPVAIVSAVESHVLVGLPGQQRVYRSWREYRDLLAEVVGGA